MNDSAGPSVEPAVIVGSREQLLHLLAEAAEIEHTLMCSYLYAAFSLRGDDDPGLSPVEARAVVRWRDVIMEVAVQEMGHLILVANLTVAFGGRPHFSRPNFPVAPGYFPSGVVVRLSGFSMQTLEHFIYLERPQGIDEADSEAFDHGDYRRGQKVVGLMPSAQEYETIGHLYEAIATNIRSLSRTIGEQQLFIGAVGAQVGPAVIDLAGVIEICDVASALSALDTIVEQGEGSQSDRDESHYQSFVGIRAEYESLLAANSAFAPAWPVADNPVLRRPPDPIDRVYIDDIEAAAILDFGCASYGLLLRMLVQCFGRSGTGAIADQKSLMNAAIGLMHAVGAAGRALARLPASATDEGVHAGMSFTMLRGIEPLVAGGAEETLLKEQLERLATGISRVPAIANLSQAGIPAIAATFRLGDTGDAEPACSD